MRFASTIHAILATGFLIAGSICVAASYVSAAAWLGGKTGRSMDKLLDGYLGMFRGLLTVGQVFIAIGVALAIWAAAGPFVQRKLAEERAKLSDE